MGISRNLFVVALSQIYRQVELHAADQKAHQRFHDLKRSKFVEDVRHLSLQSSWFCETETHVPWLPFLAERKNSANAKLRIRQLTQTILPLLTSVEEVTLTLDCDDYFPDPYAKSSTFAPFAKALWSSLSPRLRKLRLSTTTKGLQNILTPALLHNFPTLTDLDIAFISEDDDSPPSIIKVFLPRSVIINIISPFLESVAAALESLTLFIPTYFTPLCGVLGQFPRLRKLDIHLVTLKMSLHERFTFISFLSAHEHQLEYLKFRLHAMNHPHSLELYSEICNLNFACLETLELGSSWQYLPKIAGGGNVTFPDIPTVKTFIMDGVIMSDENVMFLIQMLARHCPHIHRLQLQIVNLDAVVFDGLNSDLPELKELDLTYSLCIIDFDMEGLKLHQCVHHCYYFFLSCMEYRHYPGWSLQRLKITSDSPYFCRHHDAKVMQAVASCFPHSSPTIDKAEHGCDGNGACAEFPPDNAFVPAFMGDFRSITGSLSSSTSCTCANSLPSEDETDKLSLI